MNFRKLPARLAQRPAWLLLVAATLHIIATISLMFIGTKQLRPETVDANGTAISITPDAIWFLEDTVTLSDHLRQGDLTAWFSLPYSFHVKVYAISFAIFGPLFGKNILSAEPLNLLYYLGIVILVYKLGTEVFSSSAGLVAACIVALWPSLFLHTTQMVKDSLFICEMLGLILALTRLLQHTYTNRAWLLDAVFGGLCGILLWKTRSDLAVAFLTPIVLAGSLLVIRYLREKATLSRNAVGIVIVLAITSAAMLALKVYKLSEHPRMGSNNPSRLRDLEWWQWAERVGELRDGFIEKYAQSGSNVGTDVRITNSGDLVAFLPRAAATGLFAPFPWMWLEKGKLVGQTARRLSGMETVLMYAIELLAALAVWRLRKKESVWLLTSIGVMGVFSLGLVVTNVGALYRQRYLFLIMFITLAAGEIWYWLHRTRESGATNTT